MLALESVSLCFCCKYTATTQIYTYCHPLSLRDALPISAVQLRFDLRHSPSLPAALRARAERLAGRRLTREGVLVVTANRFRSQERNRVDALERLVALLCKAAVPPTPRRATRTQIGRAHV